MGAKYFVLLPNSKTTGFVPAKWTGKDLTPYTKAEFRALEIPWREFVGKAAKTAEKLIAKLEAKYYRGPNDVITYAVIVSDNPLLPSVIASPAFRKRFEDKLGPEFYAVIPDRSTIVLLPKIGGNFNAVGEEVESIYDIATYPVSLELIEVKKDGIRVIGTFGEN